MWHRKGGTSLGALCAVAVAVASCDVQDTVTPVDVDELDLREEVVRLLPGQSQALHVVDGSGNDVTGSVAWRMGDATTARVEDGILTADAAGLTWVYAETPAAVDSARVVVSFGASTADGVAYRIAGLESSTFALTGVSFLHDRIDSDLDVLTVAAVPGEFDPDQPPGFDFQGDGPRFHVILDHAPSPGAERLESWILQSREDGGFGLVGGNGVAIWLEDPSVPDQVQLYVSVGEFDVEFDRVDVPELAGVPSGVLTGRVGFDAAGLLVDVSAGIPMVVDQLADTTVRVFAEFSVALRLAPIGVGSIGVEGGPRAFEETGIGAPVAGRYRDGLLLNYHLALRSSQSSFDAYANQIWIGSPREGAIPLEAVDASVLDGPGAYVAGRAWAWSGAGSDVQAVFRGEGEINGFSTGGAVTVTRFVPATDDVYGIVEGSFEIPERVFVADGSTSEQTVFGTFKAPILPHSLAARAILPPSEIPGPDDGPPDLSRARLGDGRNVISGRAIEDELIPVAGVRVTISGPGGEGEVISNAGGAFRFEGLVEGDYTLEITEPEGSQLADGQARTIASLRIRDGQPTFLDVNLADAEGNGTFRALAYDAGAGAALAGVRLVVRPAGGGEAVATLVTPDGSGMVWTKLQPGAYQVEIEAPDGFRLADGQEGTLDATVKKGHLTFDVVRLVAS